MRLHLAQLGLVLRDAEVGEVGQPRPLEDEEPRIGVAGHTRIRRIENEGLVQGGILFGSGERRRHRLDTGAVERPTAIGIHLDGASTLPTVQRLEPAAERRTTDWLLAGPKWTTVRGDTGEGEENDRDPEADSGKPRHPGAQTTANGGGDQAGAGQQPEGRPREEQGWGRGQPEDRAGLRRGGS